MNTYSDGVFLSRIVHASPILLYSPVSWIICGSKTMSDQEISAAPALKRAAAPA